MDTITKIDAKAALEWARESVAEEKIRDVLQELTNCADYLLALHAALKHATGCDGYVWQSHEGGGYPKPCPCCASYKDLLGE